MGLRRRAAGETETQRTEDQPGAAQTWQRQDVEGNLRPLHAHPVPGQGGRLTHPGRPPPPAGGRAQPPRHSTPRAGILWKPAPAVILPAPLCQGENLFRPISVSLSLRAAPRDIIAEVSLWHCVASQAGLPPCFCTFVSLNHSSLVPVPRLPPGHLRLHADPTAAGSGDLGPADQSLCLGWPAKWGW